MQSENKNQIVGVKIKIRDGIPAGILSIGPDNNSFASKSIEIESIGIESNNFISNQ